jgi:hypothetical protein
MVDLLRATGAAVRGLALPAFMDNALRQAPAIRQGKMLGFSAPDEKLPHTAARDTGAAARDTGAAAAGLLIDRGWSGQEDVPVLGPEELSYADLAAIVSEFRLTFGGAAMSGRTLYMPTERRVMGDCRQAALVKREWRGLPCRNS